MGCVVLVRCGLVGDIFPDTLAVLYPGMLALSSLMFLLTLTCMRGDTNLRASAGARGISTVSERTREQLGELNMTVHSDVARDSQTLHACFFFF